MIGTIIAIAILCTTIVTVAALVVAERFGTDRNSQAAADSAERVRVLRCDLDGTQSCLALVRVQLTEERERSDTLEQTLRAERWRAGARQP